MPQPLFDTCPSSRLLRSHQSLATPFPAYFSSTRARTTLLFSLKCNLRTWGCLILYSCIMISIGCSEYTQPWPLVYWTFSSVQVEQQMGVSPYTSLHFMDSQRGACGCTVFTDNFPGGHQVLLEWEGPGGAFAHQDFWLTDRNGSC